MAGGAHQHIVELSQVPRLPQDLQTVPVESYRQLHHLEIGDCQESPRHDLVRTLAFNHEQSYVNLAVKELLGWNWTTLIQICACPARADTSEQLQTLSQADAAQAFHLALLV